MHRLSNNPSYFLSNMGSYACSCVHCHFHWIHFWIILIRTLKNQRLRFVFPCYISALISTFFLIFAILCIFIYNFLMSEAILLSILAFSHLYQEYSIFADFIICRSTV